MIYKRFIFATFSFTILLTFLFGIINLFFYKVPQNTLWIKNCFTIKDKYADSIKTKKIVFSSGSNTLYGLNTIEIEKNIGIKSVNLAIHAGLQTDYILYRTKKVLKPGDIVVLPFEYQMLTWNGEDDDTRTDYILTHDKNFFFSDLTLGQQLSMIYSISIKDFLKSIEQQLKTPSKSKNGEGYTSDTLNKNGDETFKSGVKNNVINTNFDPFHLQNNFFKTKALNLILDFSKWCKTNNIRLFMTYPNTISNKNYFDDKYVKYFNMLEKFYNDNEINVISEPHLSMYSKEFFYDTQYHMNIKGSKIRTIKMISDLKKAL